MLILLGVLVQHGLKVTCEVRGHFRGILQKSYKSTAFLLSKWWPAEDDVSVINRNMMHLSIGLCGFSLVISNFTVSATCQQLNCVPV